ncbi:Mannose-1-phosphate guanyltransferase alpha-B [Trichoplax sp. H2]|nr:Mannose-1-phosphate guanyltransferase alpha-B [Trichoplax sp. H2]|eukprot:RDD39038.1 Mannose-1-phosphate guanyltransferase alpha-B [Trichoplax sp. H2]
MLIKAIILIGGPQKGTRFRPLSLELPKPLFPVAGIPMIEHHVAACAKIPEIKEVLLIGFYQQNEYLLRFIEDMKRKYDIFVRYLQEFCPMGTGGGIYHFRDQITLCNPQALLVCNADVCCDFPFSEMIENYRNNCLDSNGHLILGTEASSKQAPNYGCIVENEDTHEVLHYVEKPETFISDIINCGIYLFSPSIIDLISKIIKDRHHSLELSEEPTQLERHILTQLASSGKFFVHKNKGFWSQIKTSGNAIYANRHYLHEYHLNNSNILAENGEEKPTVLGDVYIHPTASIDPSAVVGPNVSIGSGVTIGPGVRVRESILLDKAELKEHCCVMNTIIGWNCSIGQWSRIEGTPADPNPNDPFARLDSDSMFDEDGHLTPSITILGRNVHISPELVIRNAIVLPHKEITNSFQNAIIL